MNKIIAILFFIALLCIVYPQPVYAIENTFSAGGTVYLIYDAGANNTLATAKYVTGADQDMSIIRNQLNSFCRAGQRKIGLLIGHRIIDSPPDILKTRIKNVIDAIIATKIEGVVPCFNEIQFRFLPVADYNPVTWPNWDENKYQKNKSYIFFTRDFVKATVGSAPITVYFDLGSEIGGKDINQGVPYVKRLWKDYTDTYGTGDSYGFSIIGGGPAFTNLMAEYDAVGVRPLQYAVDVYDNQNATIPERLQGIYDVMKQKGEQNKPVLIQETYQADPIAYQQILTAIQYGMKIRTVMQWQTDGRDLNHNAVRSAYIYLPPYTSTPTPTPTTIPGDLTSTGDTSGNHVNIYDYNLLVGNFGKTGSNIVGDINGDGKVDIFDFNILVGNFGK